MLAARQAVLEKLLDTAGAELAGRQADVVNDQQRDLAVRALVEFGVEAMANALAPAGRADQIPHGVTLVDGRLAG